MALVLEGNELRVDALRFSITPRGLTLCYLFKGQVLTRREFGHIAFAMGAEIEIRDLECRLKVDFQ